MIAGAAAVIARKVLADLRAIRLRLLPQQVLRRDQHARRAVAALQRIALAERVLQIGDLAAVGQPFDRFHCTTIRLHGQRQAGAHDLAIEAHGAGAADAMLATDMGAGETEVVAQEVGEIEPGVSPRP